MHSLTQADIDIIVERVVERVVATLEAKRLTAVVEEETMSCEELAAALGRKVRWVQDRCRIRKIKTVAGRRPYRIPRSEKARLLS